MEKMASAPYLTPERTTGGLTIRCCPDWTDVRCDENYQVNLSLLGDRIIFSQPSGSINLEGLHNFLRLLDRVVSEGVPADRPYVIIDDLNHLRHISLDARRLLINNLKDRKALAGIIFFNASPLFKISVKLGKSLYKGKINARLAKNFSEAVQIARGLLAETDDEKVNVGNMEPDRFPIAQIEQLQSRIIRNADWTLDFDGFGMHMEVIDQTILHTTAIGLLKARHIEPINKLREQVQNIVRPKGGIEYLVGDVSRLKRGNRASRKLYMDSLKKWNQRYPIQMYILYGANRFLKAAAHLAQPFFPFKIRIADSLQDALEIIAIDRKRREMLPSHSEHAYRPVAEDQIQLYVEELLGYLGSIDWERNGLNIPRKPEDSHPFFPVFESIALIKGELDELIQERNAAEEALRKANDSLEIRVKERTCALETANKDLRAEIKEREKTELALTKAKFAAEKANAVKSGFLANMSHELRTPLNHIIGFTDLVLNKSFGELNHNQEEYLTYVSQSSQHLLSLINDILDLSKVEAEKIELEKSEIDLPEFLKQIANMANIKAAMHAVRISLDVDHIPRSVIADERRLKQIMDNLLSNAAKFTPEGGRISIKAQCCNRSDSQYPASENSEGGVVISVSDTGIGIRSEDLDRIFKPFEQVENSPNRRFEGTGLGLTLTKRLVELHGGRLWVESQGEGQGSEFHFFLPV